MRLLLLLSLCACSGVQGIPVAPRAPTFSPTLDAPITVGQPGYIGTPERAPRGESKRVLPPTREPGIWAVHPSAETHSVEVLGREEEFVLPENHDPSYLQQCAKTVTIPTRAHRILKGGADALSESRRRCYAAMAFSHCLAVKVETFKWLHKGEPVDQMSLAARLEGSSHAHSSKAADEWFLTACAGAPDPHVDELFAAWVNVVYGGQQGSVQ